MVVDRDYMLKQQSGPSPPKLFLDTKVVPAVVNALGSVEVGLARASARTGVSATGILASAAALGLVGIASLLIRGRSRPF
jgi:hypothetical protein